MRLPTRCASTAWRRPPPFQPRKRHGRLDPVRVERKSSGYSRSTSPSNSSRGQWQNAATSASAIMANVKGGRSTWGQLEVSAPTASPEPDALRESTGDTPGVCCAPVSAVKQGRTPWRGGSRRFPTPRRMPAYFLLPPAMSASTCSGIILGRSRRCVISPSLRYSGGLRLERCRSEHPS